MPQTKQKKKVHYTDITKTLANSKKRAGETCIITENGQRIVKNTRFHKWSLKEPKAKVCLLKQTAS